VTALEQLEVGAAEDALALGLADNEAASVKDVEHVSGFLFGTAFGTPLLDGLSRNGLRRAGQQYRSSQRDGSTDRAA
jgi:hypothetical protein